MNPGEIQVALGRVTRVEQLAGAGIFLDVDLMGYMDGAGNPVQARVRWCSPYAGAGYGEWSFPDVDAAVLCTFPGVQPSRATGGDLDEGFAFAYASFSDRPPVDGPDLPLSATTRVIIGKSGVAEQRETSGALKWFLRSAASLLCDAVMRLTGTQILIVSADVQIGSGTLRKLMDERLIATFNAHTHSGVQTGGGSTGAPNQTLSTANHATTNTQAS